MSLKLKKKTKKPTYGGLFWLLFFGLGFLEPPYPAFTYKEKKIVSENVKNKILKSMRKFSDLRIDYLANYF